MCLLANVIMLKYDGKHTNRHTSRHQYVSIALARMLACSLKHCLALLQSLDVLRQLDTPP